MLYAVQPDWRAGSVGLIAIFLFGLFWSAISGLFFGMSLGGLLGLIPVKTTGQPTGTGMLVFSFFFSLPFVAIGLGVLAAPFLAVRKARNTLHAITDTRLLSVYVGRDKGADSTPHSKVTVVKRRDRRNGAGSLSIGYGVEVDSDGDPRPLTLEWTGIPDVKHAEQLILDSIARR